MQDTYQGEEKMQYIYFSKVKHLKSEVTLKKKNSKGIGWHDKVSN